MTIKTGLPLPKLELPLVGGGENSRSSVAEKETFPNRRRAAFWFSSFTAACIAGAATPISTFISRCRPASMSSMPRSSP